MPDITNPQVTQFSNDRIRPIADRFFGLWRECEAVNQEYVSQNIGSLINDAGAGNLLADGSETDGRARITGGDIYNLMTAVQAFIAWVENGAVTQADRRDVITKPHVNRI